MTLQKRYYKIGEVSAMLDVPVPTLRYWESEFEQLDPQRSEKGTRRYRQKDIEICKRIMYLLRDKGYSLEYAKKELADYRKYPPRHPFSCKSVEDALRLLSEAKSRCEDAHAVARIDAVEGWIKQTDSHKLTDGQ
jgi:transcriptional regulator, merR family